MNAPNMSRPSRTDWARVDAMTDEEIDTSDIPPLTDEFFRNATFRMPKKSIAVTKEKRCSKPLEDGSEDLLPEYDFDFSKSRPNRFANRAKRGSVVAVRGSNYEQETNKNSDNAAQS